MKTFLPFAAVAAAALIAASPASAGEVFGGIFAHVVDTPLSLDSSLEGGIDFQIGLRGGPIAYGLVPYVFGALNSKGDTNYAAIGLSRKFGDRLYIRPGVGIAIHDGSTTKHEVPGRIAFGSRLLFEPEVGIGFHLSPRATIEASWVHMSHAQLAGGQNPGIDNIGARFNFAL